MLHWRRASAVILAFISLGGLLAPRGGRAVPLYAARTGLQCGSCHFDPNGGGPRNEFGFTFARNRHSLEPEDSTSTWRDLTLVNRVGDNFPLYFGVNQRFMLILNDTESIGGLDRLGFFDMENALHLTLQPHPHLTLVYTRDGFDDGSKTQEAFGMIGGGPGSSYIKAGRIRVPFGLRMDDHTVATRHSFLDFSSGASFLPYDPRSPDMGAEAGFAMGPWFARAAFTNGLSHPFAGTTTRADAKTLKVGFWDRGQQYGLSLYDDFRRGVTFGDRHATRWGLYGLSSLGPTQLLGEIAAGTDVAVTGERNNLLAAFVELDYAPRRWLNFRGRFDHLQLARPTDAAIRDLNLFHRYALEGEILPVPFAELRWTLRWIDPRSSLLDDEGQAYLQFHFSY